MKTRLTPNGDLRRIPTATASKATSKRTPLESADRWLGAVIAPEKATPQAIDRARARLHGRPLTIMVSGEDAKKLERTAALLQPGEVLVTTGELEPAQVIALGQSLEARGAHLIELSAAGRVVMVGATSNEALERLRPGLHAWAAKTGQTWLAAGKAGAAGFARVAHDGAARAMFQAYREGFALMAGKKELRLSLPQIAQIWRFGSVIRSDILERAARALLQERSMAAIDEVGKRCGDAWPAVAEGIRLGVNLPAIDGAATVQGKAGAAGKRGRTHPQLALEAPSPVGLGAKRAKDEIRAIGMIGLGRMGANMARRIQQRSDLSVIGCDANRKAIEALAADGIRGTESLETLVAELRKASPDGRAAIWMMLPLNVLDPVLEKLKPFLKPGDVIVDGGNNNFHETRERSARLGKEGLTLVDCGTSGGLWGIDYGYAMMVGADDKAAVQRLRPLFEALAPEKDRGWGWVGPSGAGHYVKMVHNGIEYGMMEALAEGFELLERAGTKEALAIDVSQVASDWKKGTGLESWLLDLMADAYLKNPTLGGVGPYVADTGEGRWTALDAAEQHLPAPVLLAALDRRFASQTEDLPETERGLAEKLLAVTRNQFGGHAIKSA
jgi:6-phosphogluconate dehydrogenase